MMVSSKLFLLPLFLCAFPIQAEQDYEDGVYDGYDNGYGFQVCADADIEVESIQLLCDSPGTYYYGSGKYRDSQTCKGGDKAKLKMQFAINDAERIYENGSALVSIKVQGSNAVDNVVVYGDANLCSLGALSPVDGKTACPAVGQYVISTQFYWGDSDSGNEFSPVVVVGFKSSLDSEYYDLGGANTDDCEGNTFFKWSEGVRKTYANALSNFMTTFGILTATLVVMMIMVWFLWKRPKIFLGDGDGDEDLIDEDARKIQLVGRNRDLVDLP